jgi:HD-like signal output (HDOD) protein
VPDIADLTTPHPENVPGKRLSREESLQACLAQITRLPDFPSFSENVAEVLTAALREDTSAQQLAKLVMRDYSLTLKVLRTANSALYNRSGKPLFSITHAMAMLGVDAVRNIAGSLLYLPFPQEISRRPGVGTSWPAHRQSHA